MPQIDSTETTTPPAPAVLYGKGLEVCRSVDDVLSMIKNHGFACVDTNIVPPWSILETLMNRMNAQLVEDINDCYNDNKIIKMSTEETKQSVDRKLAFDICPQRLAALKDSGKTDKIPELDDMLGYFSKTGAWIGDLAADLGFSSVDTRLNYRMIHYPQHGSCLPHRDFGLLTLVDQNGVDGLMVECGGRMVPVPGHCCLVLAGWCLHLLTNGHIPAPLHQVMRPTSRRLSCVTFLAPAKETVLTPVNCGERVYKDISAGELKTLMAKRWRVREGTLQSQEEEETSQDDFVFNHLRR